ncbi:glycosyltransferase [Akkermansiaceae bacterium]|nr:glycosyltransferase [Akkermansiaceae bacterium]
MKVAHILSYFPGQEGLTSFCRGLGTAFVKIQEIEVPIITFRFHPPKNLESEQGPLLVKFPNRNRHPFDIPREFLTALDSGELKLDGAVLHGTYSPQVYALARALCKRGIPYIFMPHDPYVKKLRRHHAIRKFVYWHLCEKWVIENAAAVQLLSSSHEGPLRELGCKTLVHTLANGCDPGDLAKIGSDARTPGEGRDFVIQYLGRMDRNHKGLDLLIRGYARFLHQIPEDSMVKLVLSGNDWEDRKSLESLAAELGLGDRIHFTGRLEDHSVVVHSRADLSVLCSRFDGFGLTIVEAMLAGRPVLVSSEAGIANFVKEAEAGFVVEPDEFRIQEGLLTAWEKRAELATMGDRAQSYVMKNLTWEMVARRSLTIYTEVFGQA